MSDELQKQLAELLKFLLAQAQDATAWAKTEIPPLVWETVWFGRIWHVVVVLACAITAWIVSGWLRWCYRKADEDESWFFAMIACAGYLVTMTIITAVNAEQAILAWVAPRLYIVEWLLSLTTAQK